MRLNPNNHLLFYQPLKMGCVPVKPKDHNGERPRRLPPEPLEERQAKPTAVPSLKQDDNLVPPPENPSPKNEPVIAYNPPKSLEAGPTDCQPIEDPKPTKEPSNNPPVEKKETSPEPAKFNSAAFVYSITNTELRSVISSILSSQGASASMSPQAKQYYDFALSLHEKFASMIQQDAWEEYDQGKDWKGYTMSCEGLLCAKSIGTIKASPIELFAYLSIDKYKFDHNDTLAEIETVEDYRAANMKLVKMHSKSKLFVSARELVFINHYVLDSAKGSIELVSASVDDPRVPLDSSYVRGEIKVDFTPWQYKFRQWA
eukprot:TRINITY_DN1056_c0_g1_i1.p1 TRINITY_DN1056_c0_g1~~TRINITY_DN1056_c0_g1_i1.p1  ORF type:complete len:315 (-),score=14.11 TRINITY_DN1056_c0_g1_i1:252-1196(-)